MMSEIEEYVVIRVRGNGKNENWFIENLVWVIFIYEEVWFVGGIFDLYLY